MGDEPNEKPTVYSIGHSNHTIEKFIRLLKLHGIQILADVRSSPYSRYVTHFNRLDLEDAVERQGIQYLFMGDTLGGRPEGDEFYDAESHVLYSRLAEAPFFLKGIERLTDEAAMSHVAFMCSEEDPTNCHRRMLISRVLSKQGVQVGHIRGDGSVQTEADLAEDSPPAVQMSLFGDEDAGGNSSEERAWRSILPVSRRRPQPNSLNRSNDTESGDFWTSD